MPKTSADGAVTGLPGRQGQAARNDAVILDAAREVFLADPKAPISAVAARAGVGISALYRRHGSKEELLRRLCHDGLLRFIAEAEAALSRGAAAPATSETSAVPETREVSPGATGADEEWAAFAGFLTRVVDADVHSLTVRLAGTFTPTPEMGRDALRANELVATLVGRARAGGRLRSDVAVQDVGLLLEGCAAIRLPDPARTGELRRRYLAVLLAGLAAAPDPPLPGPPPTEGELSWRWQR